MVSSGSQTLLEGPEYDAIEAAVAETERGRRFLAEFGRRRRGADTDTLLTAIARLEQVVTRDVAALRGPDDVQGDLAEMAETLARTRVEMAAMTLPDAVDERPVAAAEVLDTIVRGTERATSDILGAAEAMQEAAWSLREAGADTALCDVLDRRAIEIYTACSVQDVTAQRTSRLVETLRDLETRIAALTTGHGSPAVQSPASDRSPPPIPVALPAGEDLDFLPSPLASDPPPVGPQPRPAGCGMAGPDDLATAFADLDRLSIEEKIALFS